MHSAGRGQRDEASRAPALLFLPQILVGRQFLLQKETKTNNKNPAAVFNPLWLRLKKHTLALIDFGALRRADGTLGIVRRAQTWCSWATWGESSWEGTKGSARRVSHFPGTLEMNKLIFHWAITPRASLMIHGHGQGASRSLEKVLIKFQQGEHCVTTLELGRLFI